MVVMVGARERDQGDIYKRVYLEEEAPASAADQARAAGGGGGG